MSFAFHPEAEEEFNEAIDYYENIEPALGYDFAIEVHETTPSGLLETQKVKHNTLKNDQQRSTIRSGHPAR